MRSDETVWDPFGAHVGKLSRSAWLNMFMEAVNENPEAWLAAFDRYGNDLGAVVTQLLAWHQRQPNAKMPRRPAANGDEEAQTA